MGDIVVDAHLDIAFNYFGAGRPFTVSAWRKRRQEAGTSVATINGHAMVGLPEMRLGRVAVACGTVFTAPRWASTIPNEYGIYDTPEQAYGLGSQQIDYYHRLADEHPKVDLVLTQVDLDAVLATWEDGTTLADHHVGLVILMEGADPILEPAQVEEWYARGLRVIGPAWSRTRYSGGTGAMGPLTDLGRELLDVMADFGMILDLSHMAPEAAREAVDRYEGALLASHANPLTFCPDRVDRNLSDGLIRQIAERDGVVGIVPYNLFLVDGWRLGDRKDAATLDTVIGAIDHVCQVTGSADHVGIGSDFDGGFGSESTPLEFETIADLWEIGCALRSRGFAPEHVSAILSGNFLRVLRAGLPEK